MLYEIQFTAFRLKLFFSLRSHGISCQQETCMSVLIIHVVYMYTMQTFHDFYSLFGLGIQKARITPKNNIPSKAL